MSIVLPNCPPEAVPIGTRRFAVLISDDTFIYFSNLVPLDSHPADDRVGTEAVFPGTELRMTYEIAGDPESTQTASTQINRGQEA